MTAAQTSSKVRKATVRDIKPVLAIINAYAAQELLRPRTGFDLSENIREFSVLYEGESLARCGTLLF